MINVFVSRPNWIPTDLASHLSEFYECLTALGLSPKTIGTNVVPMASPFEEVVNLMQRCHCTIVLGMPQIFVDQGCIKTNEIKSKVTLPTEWNQIETTASIMLKKPTLVLLHKSVIARGVFERGAANVFVHEFDCSFSGWCKTLEPSLCALKERVNA